MSIITFHGAQYQCQSNETVMDCLERHNVSVPSSCRSGICQTCLMRAVSGQPSPDSQKELKASLKARNYFLPCVCKPSSDLTIASPDSEALSHIPATVIQKQLLNPRIVRLRLRPEQPFEYRTGQFINLFRHDNLARSYSVASLPQYNEALEIHVRYLENGKMSTWLHHQVFPGDRLIIEGPHGDCFYQAESSGQPLLLIGTGCGLAPLYGIVRDALDHGHSGAIYLFHGSSTRDGLYLVDELRHLAEHHANFFYTPCISSEPAPKGFAAGRAEQIALDTIKSLESVRLFLCGHPSMVRETKRKAFLAGASLKEIYVDPFVINSGPVTTLN